MQATTGSSDNETLEKPTTYKDYVTFTVTISSTENLCLEAIFNCERQSELGIMRYCNRITFPGKALK